MNRFSMESRRNVRRASAVTALAAAATGAIVFGPSPIVMADLMHQASGNTTVERAVEHIAAETYDTTVFAHCAPIRSLGKTSMLYHTVRLNPSICTTLESIIANPEAVDTQDADNVSAVLVVAHELSHANGAGLHEEGNEGVTQCLGVQRSEQVAEALGIPAEKANVIGDLAAAAVSAPPRPDYAIPSGCVDGGPYDINAPGDHFSKDPVAAFVQGN